MGVEGVSTIGVAASKAVNAAIFPARRMTDGIKLI